MLPGAAATCCLKDSFETRHCLFRGHLRTLKGYSCCSYNLLLLMLPSLLPPLLLLLLLRCCWCYIVITRLVIPWSCVRLRRRSMNLVKHPSSSSHTLTHHDWCSHHHQIQLLSSASAAAAAQLQLQPQQQQQQQELVVTALRCHRHPAGQPAAPAAVVRQRRLHRVVAAVAAAARYG